MDAVEAEVAQRDGRLVAVFRDGHPVTGCVGADPAAAIGRFLDEAIERYGSAVPGASA